MSLDITPTFGLIEGAATNAQDFFVKRGYPNPKGLLFGLGSVLVGQVAVFLYHYVRRSKDKAQRAAALIQYEEPSLAFWQELKAHACGAELLLVVAYLSITWMTRLMPDSYYDWEAPFNALHLLLQLLCVDFLMWIAHWGEHRIKSLFVRSHLAHHKFTNPKLFDAFNASILDASIMILVPLFLTAHLLSIFIDVSNTSYAAFGTTYAGYFLMIHSEYTHVWDPLMELLGVGTAEDHHVHHVLFKYNFGHFFVYWDKLFGTYRHPALVERLRRCGIEAARIAQQKQSQSEASGHAKAS